MWRAKFDQISLGWKLLPGWGGNNILRDIQLPTLGGLGQIINGLGKDLAGFRRGGERVDKRKLFFLGVTVCFITVVNPGR